MQINNDSCRPRQVHKTLPCKLTNYTLHLLLALAFPASFPRSSRAYIFADSAISRGRSHLEARSLLCCWLLQVPAKVYTRQKSVRADEGSKSHGEMANYLQEASDRFHYIHSCELNIPFRIKM